MEDAQGLTPSTLSPLHEGGHAGGDLQGAEAGLDVVPELLDGEERGAELVLELGHDDQVLLDQVAHGSPESLVHRPLDVVGVALDEAGDRGVVGGGGEDPGGEDTEGDVQGRVNVKLPRVIPEGVRESPGRDVASV